MPGLFFLFAIHVAFRIPSLASRLGHQNDDQWLFENEAKLYQVVKFQADIKRQPSSLARKWAKSLQSQSALTNHGACASVADMSLYDDYPAVLSCRRGCWNYMIHACMHSMSLLDCLILLSCVSKHWPTERKTHHTLIHVMYCSAIQLLHNTTEHANPM